MEDQMLMIAREFHMTVTIVCDQHESKGKTPFKVKIGNLIEVDTNNPTATLDEFIKHVDRGLVWVDRED